MNCENSFRVFVEGVVPVNRFEVRRNQPCLPVVAMNDIGLPAHCLENFQNPTTEENEPLVVVVIVLLCTGVNVQPGARKKLRITKEIDLEIGTVVTYDRRLDTGRVDLAPNGNLNILQPDHFVQSDHPRLVETALN